MSAPVNVPVVDAWVNLATGERGSGWGTDMAAIDRLFHRSSDIILKPRSPAELVDVMDEAGVATAFLTAATIPGGFVDVFDDLVELAGRVAGIVEEFPGRFENVPLIGPRRGLGVVRAMRTAVRNFGVRGFHLFPVLIERAPSDATLYPLYAEAAQLDVPMVINVGMPGPAGYADLQRPMHLDRVCTDFPELRVVAAHIGAPWQAEVLWLMGKHQNLTMMTSAWAPRRYPSDVVAFLRSARGRGRVMFATDYPIIDFGRALGEIAELGLDEPTARAFLGENARRTFGLDPAAG